MDKTAEETMQSSQVVQEHLSKVEYNRYRDRLDELCQRAEVNDQNAKNEVLSLLSDRNQHPDVRILCLNAMTYAVVWSTAEVETAIATIVNDPTENAELRNLAINRLCWIGKDEVKPVLLRILDEEKVADIVRTAAIKELARFKDPKITEKVIPYLFSLKNNYERKQLAEDFRRSTEDWKHRMDLVLNHISSVKLSRTTLDSVAILAAISPLDDSGSSDQAQFSEGLIARAMNADRILTGVIAKLLVQYFDGSQDLAGQAIKSFEMMREQDAEALRSLRVMIGGEVALEGIMNKLEQNLDKFFTAPIEQLNDETRKMWQTTIKQAQTGFVMRIVMSGVVFCLGVVFLLCSLGMFFFSPQLSQTQIFGSGVSLISGFGMILAVVYSGPLKEIRQSVNDMGTASAAFIAYVHRVLEISHTFSYYYLTQKMTFEEMEKSSHLIEESLNNTVEKLKNS